MNLPTQARVVIVGGGIAGCATAYHLAKLGIHDILLLEQGQLTGGTTWHAAGLIGQLRPNRSMTAMSRYGIELYASLEAETGLSTGWRACGSLSVARTRDRLRVLRRQISLARGFGVQAEEISLAEAAQRFPLMRTDDLEGAVWIPGDGRADPAGLCMSLAKGARLQGATLLEGIEVIGVMSTACATGRRVTGVRTRAGDVGCEILINCAGQWARQFGRLAGVNVPLFAAEHFYLVSDRIPGTHPMLPVLRDPDGHIYYREEVGGLLMGGFEPKAKPWMVDPIPSDFRFQLLNEDWEQFEPLMQSALHRTPCLAQAPIKMLLNGPESFTPDGNFILGEAPELGGFFVCAGFNSAGIASSGGAGRLIAEWVAAGEPPGDLWEVDIRRFHGFTANRRWLASRTAETLGLHYAMRWPRQELASGRPLRTSALHDLLAARGAVFGSRNGWERANHFLPAGEADPSPTLDAPGWLRWVREEQRATREAVAVFDQSSFGKLLLQGPDALSLLQRLCANQIDVPIGRMVYTPMLNRRGGIESDLTVTRLEHDRFLLLTGSAQPQRDADWIRRHLREGEHAVLTDITGMLGVLSVMGPQAALLLSKLSPDDFSPQAFKPGSTREIDLADARVRAARMSYVGGPGFELQVPVEMMRHVYRALHAAGADLPAVAGVAQGLRDAGYYAIDALRIEAGRRAWGAEIGPDETPWEAGLDFAVCLDKGGDFIGREALLKSRELPPRKKLVAVALDDPQAWAWGGEPLLMNGEPVGELSSAGYGLAAGRCVGLAWLRGEASLTNHLGSTAQVLLWGEAAPAQLWDRAPWWR